MYRQDFATGKFELTHNCIATFVAVDRDGRPYRGLPKHFDLSPSKEGAELERLAEQRKQRSAKWRQAQDEVTAMRHITHDMIPRVVKDTKHVVDIGDTVVETRHAFTMKDANCQGTVFGGVILDWMVSRPESRRTDINVLTISEYGISRTARLCFALVA